MTKHLKHILLGFFFSVCWVGSVLFLYDNSIDDYDQTAYEQALIEARTAYGKDLATRRVIAKLGGVYGQVSDYLQPNPYLDVPKRDVTTTSGKNLTLINPAFMLRMLYSIKDDASGITAHITSLDPINPDNGPDEWEIATLKKFEGGEDEIHSREVVDGKPVLRYMRAMVVQDICLKCHAKQGYDVGDIRGGISTTVPMQDYLQSNQIHRESDKTLYSIVGFTGIGFILIATIILLHHEKFRDQADAVQQETEEALRRERARLDALATLGQMTSASVNELTNYTLEQAVQLTESTIGYLAFVNNDEASITISNWSQSVMEECKIKDKPIEYHINEVGLWGEVLRQRKPIITNDYAAESFQKNGTPEGHVPISRYMSIPVFDNDKIVTVVGVGNKEMEYGEDDVHQLTLLLNGMWNILQRKRSEEKLHDINVHLEQRVKERTKRLRETNRQLSSEIQIRKQTEKEIIKAKETAEEATKTKSNFLANMSHEIRTPMNAVIGMTYLAKATPLTPIQQDYLDKIDLSAHLLLGIINDILDISKIEAGMMNIDSIDFFIDKILEQVSTIVSPKAREKELELLINQGPDVPHCLVGDPMRLSQILVNLCTNAVKFTEEGEIIVAIETVKKEEDHVWLRFSVKDDGMGIRSSQIDELFQPFTQADTATTRNFGGTGLGLNLCKTLVELMGGTIGAESEYGKGSLFWAELPFKICSEKREQVIIPDEIREMPVLVVDDNPTSLTIFKRMFVQMGMDVTLAKSGRQAIEILQNSPSDKPFKLILLDWLMPIMDGLETAEAIKANPDISPTPPMILTSAYSNKFLIDRSRELGFGGLLQKPVSLSLLFNLIVQLFSPERVLGGGTRNRDENNTNLAGKTILLVEDNEINSHIAREILTEAGLHVHEAFNGQEALDFLDENQVDLVLMDVRMPGMDGYEATARLRELDKYQDLPIIAMTAHALVSDIEKCLAAGMNDHIAKPFDPDKLIEVIAKWTGRHSA